jgi:hypothetical protein
MHRLSENFLTKTSDTSTFASLQFPLKTQNINLIFRTNFHNNIFHFFAIEISVKTTVIKRFLLLITLTSP